MAVAFTRRSVGLYREVAGCFRAFSSYSSDLPGLPKQQYVGENYESRPGRMVSLNMNRQTHSHDVERASGLITNRVTVNGARIHYTTTGHGNHAVLLLPGALGCAKTDYEPQLNGMNKAKFSMICFDPRGYGNSRPPDRDWPADYFRRDAEDAVDLMKKLSIKKFSVMGWSDGGITGLVLASQYPDLVRRLVVWGDNAYVSPQDVQIFEGMSDIDTWSERMKKPFLDVYGENYFRAQWQNWVKAYCRYYYEKGGDICKEEVKKIKCPTLIIHGEKDPLVPPEHPSYLHSNIPHAKLKLMPEGKHNLHMRFAAEFNQIVEKFLEEK